MPWNLDENSAWDVPFTGQPLFEWYEPDEPPPIGVWLRLCWTAFWVGAAATGIVLLLNWVARNPPL